MDALKPFFTDNLCRICDCTVGGTYIWRDYHKTEYAEEDGVLYLKVGYPEPAFAPPRSDEPAKESYERIIQYCTASNVPPLVCAVSETVLQDILKKFPRSNYRTDRDWSDYLYLCDDLINLSGRKYAGQRNHINRFTREHTSWSFERIKSDQHDDVKAFLENYSKQQKKDSPAYIEGNIKALEVLDNLEKYKLSGGALYVGGEVAGVSFGEVVDDTLFVHIEKANTDFHGSYPMLLSQFARMFSEKGTKYVNREEDDGDEGLRTSKLSYHPIEILHKYTVELVQ